MWGNIALFNGSLAIFLIIRCIGDDQATDRNQPHSHVLRKNKGFAEQTFAHQQAHDKL